MNKLFRKENGDSNVMTILILVVVALGLCIIFRNTIKDIMTMISGKVKNGVNSLANETIGNGV